MAIDAVKIPQNVYVEDRIIGPVTLRQIIITGLGAGLSYALYAAATKSGVTNVVGLVACWIPALIAAMFSFLKINDLTLFNIILLTIEGMNKPSKRIWVPDAGLSINIVTKPSKTNMRPEENRKAVSVDSIAEVTRELQERESKLKALTVQAPLPLETSESDETVQVRQAPKAEGSALPVNRSRVRTEELSTERTIDGVLTQERMHHLYRRSSL